MIPEFYEVTITYTDLVWAESEAQAQDFVSRNKYELEQGEPEVDCNPVGSHPAIAEQYGYRQDDFVYNAVDDSEVTFRKCIDSTEEEWEQQQNDAKRKAEIEKRQLRLF